jgi:predicted membrane protein
MSGAIFWGSILLIIGLAMIVNVIFKIDLPIVRIAVAAVLIFIGIKILLGKHIKVFNHESAACNYSYNYKYSNDQKNQEYNVVFSKGQVDLRNVVFENNENKYVQVHTVFGNTDVYLNKETPCKITANTAFAQVNVPSGNEVVMGTSHYQSDSLDTNKPYLDVKIDCVFGNVKVIFY